MRLTEFTIATTLMFCSAVASAPGEIRDWRSRLTFHASFDTQGDADFAAGDAKIYTAHDMSRKTVDAGLPAEVTIEPNGRWNGCLRFRDTTKSVVFYHGDQNVPYAKRDFAMTISFWMSLHPDQDLKPGYVDPLQITDKKWNDASLFVDFTKDDTPRQFRLGLFSDYKFWNPADTPWDDIPQAERPMVTVVKPPFSRDKWTHVAIALTGINSKSDGIGQLYLDGESQGKLVRLQQFTWDPKNVAIMLGIQYIGRIDDFAVFAGTMKSTEISALMSLDGGINALRQ